MKKNWPQWLRNKEDFVETSGGGNINPSVVLPRKVSRKGAVTVQKN